MINAKITRSGKDIYQCLIEKNQEQPAQPARTVEAKALPSLLVDHKPVVGDHILLEYDKDLNTYLIREIQERNNEIYRLLVREKKKKVIAANVDLQVIVMSVSKPKYKQGLLDRYLLRSLQWEIPAVVIFNKIDELSDKLDLEFEKQRLDFLNIPYFCVSALDPSDPNMAELKKFVGSKTSIFLGQSGVGKSKLITALSDGKFDLLSGVLAKVGKGAHTTTWAQLLDFDTFQIIDSPGVRTMNLDDIFVENLGFYFKDLVPWLEKCRFSDCKHFANSQGCGFENLDPDNRDDQIVISRLESYLRLYEQLEVMPTWMRKNLLSK